MNRVTTAAMMAAVLPFVAAPTAGATSLLPPIGDATVLTHGPLEHAMPFNLQGKLCPPSKPCTTVPYDPLVVLLVPGAPVIGLETNVGELNEYIESPTIPGQKIVFAYSGGARDTYGWMQEHANDPNAPSTDDLSFVLIGNPTRKYGGTGSVVGGPVMDPVTEPYKVLDVAQQYDLISDFPQNPFNMLALANAVAGFVYLHLDYADVKVDDPSNYVWTEGNVTYVYVPTENLPLLEPLRRDGMGWLADALNAPLKAIVEQGYDRSWLPAEPQGGTPEGTSAAVTSSKLSNVKAKGRSLRIKVDDVKVDAKTDDTKADETSTEPVSESTPPSATPAATPNGGGKHRLPRTPLRDKIFGTTTKVAATTDDVAATAKSVTKFTTKAVNGAATKSSARATAKASEKTAEKPGE